MQALMHLFKEKSHDLPAASSPEYLALMNKNFARLHTSHSENQFSLVRYKQCNLAPINIPYKS